MNPISLPFTFLRTHRSVLLAVGVLVCTFAYQGYQWTHLPGVLDDGLWLETVSQVVERGVPSGSGQFWGPFNSSYGYPATVLIYPTALLVKIGVSGDLALRLVLLFFVSFGITLAVWVSYRLRPESLWWVGAWGLLLFDKAYFYATPPSTIVISYVASIILLSLLATRREEGVWPLLLLGGVGGIMLGVRFDIAALILCIVFLYMRATIGARAWYLVLACLPAFVLANPYLILMPAEYAVATAERIFFSFTTLSYGTTLPDLLASAPFGTVGFFLGVVFAFLPQYILPLPRAFLILWLAVSGVFCAVLYSSAFHPIWYFSPFFMLWQMLLPLFLLVLVRHATLSPSTPRLTHRHLEIGITIFLVSMYYVVSIHLW